MESESMVVKLASYILVPVHGFQANHRDYLNPAKSKFKVIVAVLRKDLGTRVVR